MGLIRLDKYLADMQIGTRSQVKDYIKKGRVTVSGEVVRKFDIKIDLESDKVTFDGIDISYVQYEYYMLNKPQGVVSATKDSQDTVVDLINSSRKDLFPVGRLDKDTEGLLLITNDGDLAHRLLSPKKHVDKTYYAIVKGHLSESLIAKFKEGFKVDEELYALPAKLQILEHITYNDEAASRIYITIHEGKFHQVKRMFKAVESEVLYLKRISMGSLKLDDKLELGKYRALTKIELDELKNLCE